MAYSIDAVAQLTGISAFTLRNWEKRYAFLKPDRRGNGFRMYDDEHVELLRKVSTLLRHGARIGDLAENIRKGKSLPDVVVPELAPEVQDQARALYDALMAFDQPRAEALHDQIVANFSPERLLDLVYAPLLAQLGRDWSSGEATLAQEHFASAFIRLRLAPYLAGSYAKSSPSAKRVICATPSGELHEGGILVVGAHLKLLGWNTFYLGTNMPIEEVRAAAAQIRPSLVCLSYSDKNEIRAQLPELARFECKVCIGGFGALTYDAEESLPKQVRLFKSNSFDAVQVLASLSE